LTAHDPSSTLHLQRKGRFKSLFPIVAETSAQLAWPADTATLYTLAALLLGPTLLYALPRHVRIGSPLFNHTLFGVYVGGDGVGWPVAARPTAAWAAYLG
jgi:hypothetical protein